jgi:hypothetical protein
MIKLLSEFMSIEQVVSGFENEELWETAINNRDKVLSSPAVYAIVTTAPFTRFQSISRILYIGSTGCLGGSGDGCRLYGYRYAPAGQQGSRIRNLVSQVADIGHSVYLKWRVLHTKAETAESEKHYLSLCEQEHLELPPFNRKS